MCVSFIKTGKHGRMQQQQYRAVFANENMWNIQCVASYLKDDLGHELWVWLLVGEELPDDLVHDVLWGEEVHEEGGQDAGDDARLVRVALADPATQCKYTNVDWVQQNCNWESLC